MREESKEIRESESKKIGDVNLKGIIEGIEIQCNVDLTYQAPKKAENNELLGLPKKISNKNYFIFFGVPLVLIMMSFLIDLMFDYNSHLLLFFVPLAFGYFLHKAFVNSPTSDPLYVKKSVDCITFSSSALTACLLLFKTIDAYNPYITAVYNLKNQGVLGISTFLIIFSIVYFIIWIFAASATIKFLIAFDDLVSYSRKK
ncbi:hypothetical protein [Kosakonia sp. 1610]|uniref:hypothetical protein n=1 Tax=Kosakonia sp. 1610 TaxID=3156426 RepID=UPI003D1E4219